MKLCFRYSGVYDRILYTFSFGMPCSDPNYFKDRRNESIKGIKSLEKGVLRKVLFFLSKISKTLSVDWEDKDLTIYVLPHWHKPIGMSAFSDPLTVVLMRWDGGKLLRIPNWRMVEILVHELCHVIQQSLSRTNYYKDLEKKGLKNMLVRNHLLTYAIFAKIVNSEMLMHEKIVTEKNPPYKEALELVEKWGADNIIQEARKYVKNGKG